MSDDERSAALGLAEATRAVRMAEMRLAAFDVEHWGTVFKSKDRLRRALEADIARAHVAGLEAVHHAQRVSEAAASRAATPARRGGPVPDADSRNRIVDEAIAQREPDGTWPTQTAVAGTLKLSDRRIRQVQGAAGWAGILEDAKVKARGR